MGLFELPKTSFTMVPFRSHCYVSPDPPLPPPPFLGIMSIKSLHDIKAIAPKNSATVIFKFVFFILLYF